MYSAYVTHRTPAHLVPREKLPLVTTAALAACDAKDGVKDGVLDDPRQCQFDPATLVCKGADGPDCLTAAQVDSVKKIYEGLKDPVSGTQFWPGFEISSELGWPGHILDAGGPPLSYFKYMVLRDPKWDWKTFDFSDPKSFAVLVDASRRLGPVLDSINPDLTPFRQQGGKLIAYHGWLDQNISPRNTIAYYERVKERMSGERDTQSFFRLFMVPGMGHCGGGPGTSTFDALAALEQWVEQGTAPDRIAASRVADGKVDRTRPLCVYPMVARYEGAGSTDEAANFECRVP
jgi:feruloyl esterase